MGAAAANRDAASPPKQRGASAARFLFGKLKLQFAPHFEHRLLAAADERGVFRKRRNQDRHGDGGIAVHGHHAGIVSDFAPALRFFQRAAGKPAPMRGVGYDLHRVLVAFGGVAHERRRDFRLLHEVLGCSAAEINHAAVG